MTSPYLPSACGRRRGASGGSLYPSRNGLFWPSAEAEECRVPVTLVRAAARDADFGVSEWRTCIGYHLKVRVFDEIYVHSTDAKEPMSQSGPRRCRHSPSLPRFNGHREQSVEKRFEPAAVPASGVRIPGCKCRFETAYFRVDQFELAGRNRERRIPNDALQSIRNFAGDSQCFLFFCVKRDLVLQRPDRANRPHVCPLRAQQRI